MNAAKVFWRFCHATKTSPRSEKSALALLRKKTGYTFANCKKALDIHNNDIKKAEEWLREQAQVLGWSKATKLGDRQTTQGLIGVTVERDHGIMVEVNCETDFVAKNKEFEALVVQATSTCMNFIKSHLPSGDGAVKLNINAEQLRSLQVGDGKTLADKLALLIGTVGENASLKRAVGFKVNNGIRITGYAHPSGRHIHNVMLGQLGGLVALQIEQESDVDIDKIAKNICQHVVGMNPKNIGNSSETPAANKDEENNLIYQSYLLDEDLTVMNVLEMSGLTVVDFKRFECGEID